MDAENFVTNLLTEEEAVGRVAAVPGLSRAQRQQSDIAAAAENIDSFTYGADAYDDDSDRSRIDTAGSSRFDLNSTFRSLEQPSRSASSASGMMSGLGKRRGGYIREAVSDEDEDF